MNPLRFDQPTERTLSVLVHEMVHVWQHHFGTPSKKKRHHNKEWAEKIENIGLCPSSTGKEGGERTGTKMSHYIIPNGAFDKAKDQLLREGFTLTYRYKTQATSPSRSKHKYSCPDCGLNMWGRKEANLVCGNCQVDMEPMG